MERIVKIKIYLFYPKKPYIDFLNTVANFELIDVLKGSFGTEYFRVYSNRKVKYGNQKI